MEKRGNILKDWQEKVKEAAGEQPSTLKSYSRKKFYDSIPDLLKRICQSLGNSEKSVSEIAREHGTQRWNHGLDLRELISEWSYLHLTLINMVNNSYKSLSLSTDTLATAQQKVAHQIYTGITASVDEYYKLQRMKAEVR